jgi:DNA-binding transcriptional MerR regulator
MSSQYFTLQELSRETGIDGRTIRFYISQKLLRGPDSRGRSAQYTDYHLKRLQVIKTLRDIYKLPLKEIRRHILQAGDEDIKIVALQQDSGGRFRETGGSSSASHGISSHRRRARMARNKVAESMPASESPPEELFSDPYVLDDELASSYKVDTSSTTPLDRLAQNLKSTLPGRRKPSSTAGAETWRHIEITPEIKLQVKDIFTDEDMARFEEVADYIRQILLDAEHK